MAWPNDQTPVPQVVDQHIDSGSGQLIPGTPWGAAWANAVVNACNSLQTVLGINPQGASATVADRLNGPTWTVNAGSTLLGGVIVDGTNAPCYQLKVGGGIRGYIGGATGQGGFVDGTAEGDMVVRAEQALHLGISSVRKAVLTGTSFSVLTKLQTGTRVETWQQHIHEPTANLSCYIHMTNAQTGADASRGAVIGLNSSGGATIAGFENQPLQILVNGSLQIQVNANDFRVYGSRLYMYNSTSQYQRSSMYVMSGWDVSTDASRLGYGGVGAYDYASNRTAITWGANGTEATLGFYGVSRVARQAVISRSAAYTATPSALGSAATLTDLNDLRTAFQDLRAKLETLGLIKT